MSEMTDLKKWYIGSFDKFEQGLNGAKLKPVHQLRKSAIEEFSNLNFPTVKDEEWKHTNISPLLNYNFAPSDAKVELNKADVDKFTFDNMHSCLLVFVNGVFSSELSELSTVPAGVVIKNIANAIEENHPAIEKHLGKYADFKTHIFTSLSTAFTNDGAFIFVPDGIVLENPIHVLFIAATSGNGKAEKLLIQPRNLFVAGKNSQVTIVEHYVSMSEDIYFTNTVTEVFADDSAVVDHIKLQEESRKAYHVARMDTCQERSSSFSSHMVSIGGEIARNNFTTKFKGEGGESILNGLFLTENSQLFDAHTMIDHAMPHCNSHEHYKGLLDDTSRGVFNGKVMVRKDAQKTNAFQENNNIILSQEALVNTKPQLEIFADDVKCSHGATIGQLDAESLFYLKSRGIGEEKAKTILIHAFASDVVKSVKVKAVKEYIEEILTNKFNPGL
jgi:Fe-S cluster assembly protein SufD